MTGNTHSELVTLSRMDVVEVGRRRRWSDDEKLRILEEASTGREPVRAVARRHAVAPSQIYEWRRKFGAVRVPQGSGFAPVVVAPDVQAPTWAGRMEVHCRDGRMIVVGRDVDAEVLVQVVAALER